MLLVVRHLLHGKHLRKLGQGRHLHIILNAKLIRHPVKVLHIFSSQRPVVLKAHIAFCVILVVDEQIHFSPLDIFLKECPDGSFKIIELLGHLNT